MSLRVSLSRVTLLAAVLLPACASQRLEGPPSDLHQLATPAPAPVVRLAPVPGPSVAPGRWRAWVPPQTTAAGDITAGHWIDLTLAPPRVDVVAPAAPMPRAPKTLSGSPKPAPQAGTPAQPAPSPVSTPAPAQPVGVTPATVTHVPTPRLPQALRHMPPPLAEETR
jgi:hypothetical protein